jgi:ABC-2 type transport system permease protein
VVGPLRHDFNRTMRSKTILVSMAVIILLSFAIVPVIKLAESSTVMASGSTVVLTYYESPDYHFLAYSYNSYGQPVLGTNLNVTIADHSGRHTSTESTNSSGFASWTLPGNPETGQASYYAEAKGAVSSYSASGSLPPVSNGNAFELLGDPLGSVVDPANSSRADVLFAYEGPNGTFPTQYGIYYSFQSGTGPTVTAPNETQMIFLGVPTSYVTTFRLPQIPSSATMVTLGAFGKNGTNVFYSSYSSQAQSFTAALNPNSIFTSFTSAILALVVPLMAILVAYGSYGKDRATGVLESVLSRPVTRRGLVLSRYFSLVLSIAVALVITMAVMEVISQLLIGSMLPAEFAAYTVVALIVEGATFVAILMLLSHLLKSTGGLVGVGVGLWVILDFFWGVIILVAAVSTGVQIGSGNYLGLSIDSAFFNPAQFYSLVSNYFNGVSISSSSGALVPISPSTYGLNPFTIALVGALWIIIPVALLLYVASKRD